MISYKVDFGSLTWESPMKGLRFKARTIDGRRLRLVECGKDMPPHWCESGHIGYVLEGQFELTFDDEKVVLNPGDGLFIPAGKAHRHMGKVLTDTVRVVMVEDV